MASNQGSVFDFFGGVGKAIQETLASVTAEVEEAVFFKQTKDSLAKEYVTYFSQINEKNPTKLDMEKILNVVWGFQYLADEETKLSIGTKLEALCNAIKERNQALKDIRNTETVLNVLVELLIACIKLINPSDSGSLIEVVRALLNRTLKMSHDFPLNAEELLQSFESNLLKLLSEGEEKNFQKQLQHFLTTTTQSLNDSEPKYRASAQQTLENLKDSVDPLKKIVPYMLWEQIIAHLQKTIATNDDPERPIGVKVARAQSILENFIDTFSQASKQKVTMGDIVDFVHALLEFIYSLTANIQDKESIEKKFWEMSCALKEFWQRLEDSHSAFQESMDDTTAVGPVVVDMTLFENDLVKILKIAAFDENSIDSCMSQLESYKKSARPILSMEQARKNTFIEFREEYKALLKQPKYTKHRVGMWSIDRRLEEFFEKLNQHIERLSQEIATLAEPASQADKAEEIKLFSNLLMSIREAAEELLFQHRLEFQQPCQIGEYTFQAIQDKEITDPKENVIYISRNGQCRYFGTDSAFIQHTLAPLAVQAPHLKRNILQKLAAEKDGIVYTKEQDWMYVLGNLCRALNRAITSATPISHFVTDSRAVVAELAAAGISYNARTQEYEFTESNSSNAKQYDEYIRRGQIYWDAIASDSEEIDYSTAIAFYKQYFTLDISQHMTNFEASDFEAERELYAAFQEAKNFWVHMKMNGHDGVQADLQYYEAEKESGLLFAKTYFTDYNAKRKSLKDILSVVSSELEPKRRAKTELSVKLQEHGKEVEKASETVKVLEAEIEIDNLTRQISDAKLELVPIVLAVAENNTAKVEMEKLIETIGAESDNLSRIKDRLANVRKSIEEKKDVLNRCNAEERKIKKQKQQSLERKRVLEQEKTEIAEKVARLREIETELTKKGDVESRITDNTQLMKEAQIRFHSLDGEEEAARTQLENDIITNRQLRSDKRLEIFELDPKMLMELDISGLQQLKTTVDTFIRSNPIFFADSFGSIFFSPSLWFRYFFNSKRDKAVGLKLLEIQSTLAQAVVSIESLPEIETDLMNIINEYPQIPEKHAIQGIVNKIKVYKSSLERGKLDDEFQNRAIALAALPAQYAVRRKAETTNIEKANSQIAAATIEKQGLEALEKEKLDIEGVLVEKRTTSKKEFLAAKNGVADQEEGNLPYDHYIDAELEFIKEENKRLDLEQKENAQLRLDAVKNKVGDMTAEVFLSKKQGKITASIQHLTSQKEDLERKKGNLEALVEKEQALNGEKESLEKKITSLQSELASKQQKQTEYGEKRAILESEKNVAVIVPQQTKEECELKKTELERCREYYRFQCEKQRKLEEQVSSLDSDIQTLEKNLEQARSSFEKFKKDTLDILPYKKPTPVAGKTPPVNSSIGEKAKKPKTRTPIIKGPPPPPARTTTPGATSGSSDSVTEGFGLFDRRPVNSGSLTQSAQDTFKPN